MIYAFADYELDTGVYELRRGGEAVPLEPQVYDLLAYLVANHDRLVTKEELVGHVWPERFVSEGALNSRLMAVRRALGDSGKEQRLVRTVHGRGYRFMGPLVSSDRPAVPNGHSSTLDGSLLDEADAPRQRIGFCRAGDGVRVAYATSGRGPALVKTANWLTHLELEWGSPVWRHWLAELSSDHTLIRYDERGCGLSDWNIDSRFEDWVNDLEAVVAASEMDKFVLFGISQGGPVAIAYALRHPERVSKIVIHGGFARGWAKWGSPAELGERAALLTLMRTGWGRDDAAYRQLFATQFIPGADREQIEWFSELCRTSASPETAARVMEECGRIDISNIVSAVRCPVLVTHSRGDLKVPFEIGRELAAELPGARFVPLDSNNHILLESEPAWGRFRQEFRAFLAE